MRDEAARAVALSEESQKRTDMGPPDRSDGPMPVGTLSHSRPEISRPSGQTARALPVANNPLIQARRYRARPEARTSTVRPDPGRCGQTTPSRGEALRPASTPFDSIPLHPTRPGDRVGRSDPIPGRAGCGGRSIDHWLAKASCDSGICLQYSGSRLPAGVIILAYTVPSIVLGMNRTAPSQNIMLQPPGWPLLVNGNEPSSVRFWPKLMLA